uniref:Uncharacterized protein n=1 Tax=Aegilops tauschii TaxID=37682 RepID=M8AQ25_AEGTA
MAPHVSTGERTPCSQVSTFEEIEDSQWIWSIRDENCTPQGFAGSFFRVASDYYWKDVQRVQPATVQFLSIFFHVPWVLKPLWGVMTDVFPVRGYRRRPYFVFSGMLGMFSTAILASVGLSVTSAVVCFVGISTAVAIADVTIDACIAKNSIDKPALAPDMQSLCAFSSSLGALIGYATSGMFVHHLGAQEGDGKRTLFAGSFSCDTRSNMAVFAQNFLLPRNCHAVLKKLLTPTQLKLPSNVRYHPLPANVRQGALGVMALPPTMLVFLGFYIYELKMYQHNMKEKVLNKVTVAVKGMVQTIKYPVVWKPSLYMFLSLALSISTHEGQFYWYTNKEPPNPGFSQEFVGMVHAVGAVASMVGVLIYHKNLKDYPFRSILFFAQLLHGASGLLDLTFVLRWNLALGVPDAVFVTLEECVSRVVGRVRLMPMMVLSTKLCPPGAEGTFFALLMCIDSLGMLVAKTGGAFVLRALHVTRTDFSNLWLAVLLRNLLRLSALGAIFLVLYCAHTRTKKETKKERKGREIEVLPPIQIN